MKIIGVGTDILRIERVERKLSNAAFVSRAFDKSELEYIMAKPALAAQRAAGIFCAKEACAKALGCGFCGVGIQSIRIGHDDSGRPTAQILSEAGTTDRQIEISLSISHDGDYAAAFAVAAEV